MTHSYTQKHRESCPRVDPTYEKISCFNWKISLKILFKIFMTIFLKRSVVLIGKYFCNFLVSAPRSKSLLCISLTHDGLAQVSCQLGHGELSFQLVSLSCLLGSEAFGLYSFFVLFADSSLRVNPLYCKEKVITDTALFAGATKTDWVFWKEGHC